MSREAVTFHLVLVPPQIMAELVIEGGHDLVHEVMRVTGEPLQVAAIQDDRRR